MVAVEDDWRIERRRMLSIIRRARTAERRANREVIGSRWPSYAWEEVVALSMAPRLNARDGIRLTEWEAEVAPQRCSFTAYVVQRRDPRWL